MANINKIQLSGVTYDIQDSNAQPLLSAGTGISISGNVISATGGGGGTVSSAITSGDTNAVAGGAVYDKFDEVEQVTARALNELNEEVSEKVDTSAITSSVTSASTDNEIPTAKAVWEAASGGGTSFDLPIYSGTGINALKLNHSGVTASGDYSLAGGKDANGTYTKATGNMSFAFGRGATASGNFSHAEGSSTKASGDYSHAEGTSTKASGSSSHAEGNGTTAGRQSHAEGYGTSAIPLNGSYTYAGENGNAHAEGFSTEAYGYNSHAEGSKTKANNYAEHASGQFNVSSSASTTFGDSGNTLFSVGNGTANNARHNAFEIRQNGDIYLTSGGTDIKLQDHLGGGGSSINVVQTTGSSTTDVMSQDAVTTQLSGYVTTDTEQTISGRKIFTYTNNSGKAIEFKQTSDTAKVGFSIKNSASTNNEVASFEFRPNSYTDSSSVSHPLLYLGHYRNTNTANAGVPQTVIGFRQYDQKNAAAYHYLLPLPEKAKTPFSLTTSFKDYYAPMGFKNGSTMITADNTGVADFSSVLGGLKLVKLSEAEYNALATKDSSTLYIIVN